MFASRRISTPIVGKREMALSRMRTAAVIISRCGASGVDITQVLGGNVLVRFTCMRIFILWNTAWKLQTT